MGWAPAGIDYKGLDLSHQIHTCDTYLCSQCHIGTLATITIRIDNS